MEHAWFFIALIPPVFWAMNNMIDQYLGRKYFMESATSFQAFQGTLSGIFALTLLYFADHSIGMENQLILIAIGSVMPLLFIPYAKALQIDHAGIAIPLFQLLPVFIFIGGYLILGEDATLQQLFAALLIIISSFGIIADINLKKMNWMTLWLMSLCCLGLTFYMISMRYMSDYADWFTITIYAAIGSLLTSSCIYLSKPRLITLTKQQIAKAPKEIWILSVIQEIMSKCAMLSFQYGLPLATSAALYQTVIGGIQPFYILLLGYPCYWLSKEIFEQPLLDKNFFWRLGWITLMFIGLVYLYQEI